MERKAWTVRQDNSLRELYENRGIRSWVQISRLLETEFFILNKNGKQCRERYHNHLDIKISRQKWTLDQENRLFQLQLAFGNHWAGIAKELQGRSETSVKNHFYSVLRRGLRKVNKVIKDRLKRFKDIEVKYLYKIIQACQDSHSADFTSGSNLRKDLSYFGLNDVQVDDIQLSTIKKIIKNIKVFNPHKFIKNIKDQQMQGHVQRDSDSIEAEQYRDSCPLHDGKLRRSSFSFFKLEDNEQEESEDKKEFNIYKFNPSMKKEISQQSIQSLQVNFEPNISRQFDLSQENVAQFVSQSNRFSPGYKTCDSPYFDQLKKACCNWRNIQKH